MSTCESHTISIRPATPHRQTHPRYTPPRPRLEHRKTRTNRIECYSAGTPATLTQTAALTEAFRWKCCAHCSSHPPLPSISSSATPPKPIARAKLLLACIGLIRCWGNLHKRADASGFRSIKDSHFTKKSDVLAPVTIKQLRTS